MDYKVCVFGGEWKKFALCPEKTAEILSKLVERFQIQEFRSLSYSNMDKILEQAVVLLKKQRPNLSLTYVSGKKDMILTCFSQYDAVIVPSTARKDLQGIYQWLIDCSHYCLLSSESLLGMELKSYAGEKCLLDFGEDISLQEIGGETAIS